MATLSLFFGILITMRPEEGERHFANWELLMTSGTYFKIEPLR